jgi:predicted small lipoprotein YifL
MRTLIALTLVSLSVAACGFKGPLYLPEPAKPAVPQQADTKQPSTAPAPSTKP